MKVENQSKNVFSKKLRFLLDARKKVINSFTSNTLPLKKIHHLNQNQIQCPIQYYFIHLNQQKNPHLNSIYIFRIKLKMMKKNINNEIVKEHFGYYNSLFSAKDLSKANKAENEKLASWVNNKLTDLKNDVNKKEIPENENPDRVIYIFEKIADFNIQQKSK